MQETFQKIPKWFEEKNYRFHECVWLLYAHLLGVISYIWFFQQEQSIIIPSLILFWIWHCLGGLGITGGCHRLWSHKAYTAGPVYRTFLMLMNSAAFQGSIWHWSRDHRLHHKFSDTELDPHDITKGLFFSHCGWLLKKKSNALIQEGKKIDMDDLNKDQIVMFQKENYYKLAFLMTFLIPMISGQLICGGGWMFNLLFLGFGKYIFTLNATWCVNSICHKFGSRPYNKNILPCENMFVSLITVGEGWHNWHHEYPRDWRASKDEWWMFNPTTTFIRIGTKLGLCSVPKQKSY